MGIVHSLEHVIVVPRNGYANRLQAWASTSILAQRLMVPIHVLWEPERIAPAPHTALFGESLTAQSFIDDQRFRALVGCGHSELPRYLNVDAERRLITLAGHDLGEQAFMDRLVSSLADSCEPTTLVVIAGGKFHLPGIGDFAEQRRAFYRRIDWHEDIANRVVSELRGRPSYLGLHIRQTDRSREAPTQRALERTLTRLGVDRDERVLFIASDSPEGRETWAARSRALGFDPWWVQSMRHDRADASAGVDAIVDWLLLGNALGSVYSANSSFAEEAVIAGGSQPDSIAISAGRARIFGRDLADLGHSIATYPARHHWFKA